MPLSDMSGLYELYDCPNTCLPFYYTCLLPVHVYHLPFILLGIGMCVFAVYFTILLVLLLFVVIYICMQPHHLLPPLHTPHPLPHFPILPFYMDRKGLHAFGYHSIIQDPVSGHFYSFWVYTAFTGRRLPSCPGPLPHTRHSPAQTCICVCYYTYPHSMDFLCLPHHHCVLLPATFCPLLAFI